MGMAGTRSSTQTQARAHGTTGVRVRAFLFSLGFVNDAPAGEL